MTIAPNTTAIAAPPAAAEAAVADGTPLLPAREAVLGRLAEQLPTVGTVPATLLISGLLRPDDGWPARCVATTGRAAPDPPSSSSSWAAP
jgi:hypothetical protein